MNFLQQLSRRQLLQRASCGFGQLALASLAHQFADAAPSQGSAASSGTHHLARAKRVIFLFMGGAPSHVDTFDYKPRLIRDHGKTLTAGATRTLMKSPWRFSQHGQSGMWISELFPEVAQHADKLCMLHGLNTDLPNHPEATLMMHTGSAQFIRPSLGAWTLYGLGSENENLPGFIAINPLSRFGGPQNYGSSFLPGDSQATRIAGEGRSLAKAGVAHISNPQTSPMRQREQLDLIADLHRLRPSPSLDPELENVISSYELAFRMQSTAPRLFNFREETRATQKRYGIGQRETDNFGRQCLLARRAVEAGVRFVELSVGGWDHHSQLRQRLPDYCRKVDLPIATLLADLDDRGLLADTLVVWGGEFGRTPEAQNGDGRDHNPAGFTMWMAGGGVKSGFAYGATDEHGGQAVEGKMHIHDLHATILYLLGLDHERLTYRYSGRDMRLTDIHGYVAHEIFA
ncbi:DUF1501 domain-containing protein [Lacipirellula sp.]|uniref:DUF1501 domain-containing protein n=1 Tax=Lacipirellula sp. TaxID=2691419 RepID=UPI003D0CCC54